MILKRLNLLFNEGKYTEILKILGREPIVHGKSKTKRKTHSQQDRELLEKTALQISALVFLGEQREAQVLYDRALRLEVCTDLFQAQCRFFLGVGLVRKSQYDQAATIFARNRLLLKMKLRRSQKFDQRIGFYALQGSAFFRFFRGQFLKSCDLAERAYDFAFESKFLYGQVLALDLLGHSLCHLGSVHRGLYELQRGLKIAKDLGNGGLVTALQISIMKFRAQFGVDIKNTIHELSQAVESLQIEDTYSRAEIHLELARQLILRGNAGQAQKLLDKASVVVYQFQNRRQSAIFNLRSAHLMHLRGDNHSALTLLNALRALLNPRIDVVILRQALGLELKIQRQLGFGNRLIEQRFLTALDSRISDRFHGREFAVASSLHSSFQMKAGEDVIGDIIDRCQIADLDYLYEIKNLGLLGLVPGFVKFPLGKRGVFLGPSRGEMLICSQGDVQWIERGVTTPIKKLIKLLASKQFQTKEHLIQMIWGYKYDPSMHDRLLHATVGKLRQFLGQHSSWVEWSFEGYRLLPEILVIDAESKFETTRGIAVETSEEKLKTSESKPVQLSRTQSSREGLNVRQVKLLGSFKSGDFISVKEYAKKFKVTTMTAYRDLDGLHALGQVVRIGKGRATVYGSPI